MPIQSASFATVKLPGQLVAEARASAALFRRSVAGQIEYWSMLGRSLERSGLTIADSAQLIQAQSATAGVGVDENDLDSLEQHIVSLAKSGALNAQAKVAVAANRAKAKPKSAPKRRAPVAS